jgi:hypothetical protein
VGATCGTHGEGRKVYKVLVGEPEGKRPLRKPRCGWEYGLRMDLRGLARDVDWIQLAQDRDWCRALADAVLNFRVLAPQS